MINSDGTIEFESPKARISPHTTLDVFWNSPLFNLSKPLNQNDPWFRYSFQSVMVGGEHFAGDICFCSGLIYSIDLCVIRPEFGNSWGDASVEKEQERHRFHKQLLQRIFMRSPDHIIPCELNQWDAAAEFNFPWGSVSAYTDIKAYSCSIAIKYTLI